LGEDLSVPAAAPPFLSKQCIQFWVFEGLGFFRFQGSSSALSQQKVPCEFVDFHPLLLWFMAGPNVVAEKLWLEFFSDPSQWWDHSVEKVKWK
jgi:hypothetical protein